MPTVAELLALRKARKTEEENKKNNTVSGYGVMSVIKDTKKADKIAVKTAAEGSVDMSNILQVKDFDRIVLDESQAAALATLQKHRIASLTGAAGCGKTTIIRADIEANPPQFTWEHLRAKIIPDTVFCALTGKAVAQMRLVLPKSVQNSCMTIHTLLAVHPERCNDGKMRYVPSYNAENKLGCKRIYIDESTMCPVSLWNQLRDALPYDCKVIFIGDINQLPPVGGQPILIHAMMNFPYASLEKIHRQAEGSPVLAASQRILRGQPIETTHGMVLRKVSNDDLEASYEIIDKMVALYKSGKYDPMQDQIITAGNSGALGQEELNAMLLPHITKFEMHKVFYARRFRVMSVGTKVMYTENDYSLGIFNGLQGVVESIVPNPNRQDEVVIESTTFGRPLNADDLADLEDISEYKTAEEMGVSSKEELDEEDAGRQASHIVTVLFNDGTRVSLSKASQINNLQVAFVCTCHKMQGSECRNAFIIVHKKQAMHHSREWLYTAVTRAKKSCVLFTSTVLSKKKSTVLDDNGVPVLTRASNESLNTSVQVCISSPRIVGKTTAEKIKAYYNFTAVNREAEKPKWLTVY